MRALLFRSSPTIMSSSSCEDLKPKAKRQPLRATGLALALLSFQTLGTILLFLTISFAS
jgi:hypothetical protein